ncbi:MAG: elongation factor G [Myxococcota bacterium]|jgi:elongation factor G
MVLEEGQSVRQGYRMTDLSKLRNIGISAHIDSGKTTLTERILFYTDRIHTIHDVKGKDGVGAKMDSMELERERGITIASAATHCEWDGHHINIIDTPGHVDFTIEVERALRVLDGAILVLCSVAGVQSQSLTVDRQMKRYKVPRLAFVNKCDRTGANPIRVAKQLREQLGHNPVLMQLPLGLEEKHEGVIDLVTMKAITFMGEDGQDRVYNDIPADMQDECDAAREVLLDAVSMYSDELLEAMLEENVTEPMIHRAVRAGVMAHKITPVFMGSAYKNKGVQVLMDAVVHYLPNPTDVENDGLMIDGDDETPVIIPSDVSKALVCLAFKLEDGRYGQLTYVRVYQGSVKRDDFIFNMRTGKKHRVGRLVRMHSDEMEEITGASAGDIIALFGIDCATGDTFTDGTVKIAMSSMHVPEPVISLGISPIDRKSEVNMAKALQRFTKEDPTFRVWTDQESNQTIIAGMGELHLEVYIERMKREYQAPVETSPPQVAYRESISEMAEFNYLHKKQTGGSGQYARVGGFVEPLDEGDYEFVDKVVGGAIPRQFISSVDKGFKNMMAKGPLIGHPVVGFKVTLNDGTAHAVDSSEMAFQAAAQGAFRSVYQKAKPRILEPIMKVVVEGPAEHSGNILGTLMQRRGMIIGSQEEGGQNRVEAEVPLSEMFGYSTVLRSNTQGKAEFSMEFSRYMPVPTSIGEELIKKAEDARAAG